MRLAVLCPSEIAIRRFMPALKKCNDIIFAGVGIYTREERFGNKKIADEEWQQRIDTEKKKADAFIEEYSGHIFEGYDALISSPEVDLVYIPLPPGLHYYWAKKALENGKHVLIEKPSTTSYEETKELVRIAENKKLALHENYMFVFHDQINVIDNVVSSGKIGEVRLFRISFGFPMRQADDFRFNKALGGGALIDAGGYTIRYAMHLLGPSCEIKYAQSNYLDTFEVDMYGSGALVNDKGTTAQISFGMDNDYKCELEVWGSEGTFSTGRILTAPEGFVPSATVKKGREVETVSLPADDTFYKSIRHFIDCVNGENVRKETYKIMIKQSKLVEDFKQKANWK